MTVAAPASGVRPSAARQATSGRPSNAISSLGFVPVGMFGGAADGGSALVASSTAPTTGVRPSPGGVAPVRPAMEKRPGVIAIELLDGTRLHVDALVDEGALRRVVAALRTVA